jgi:hypothetical protein
VESGGFEKFGERWKGGNVLEGRENIALMVEWCECQE